MWRILALTQGDSFDVHFFWSHRSQGLSKEENVHVVALFDRIQLVHDCKHWSASLSSSFTLPESPPDAPNDLKR